MYILLREKLDFDSWIPLKYCCEEAVDPSTQDKTNLRCRALQASSPILVECWDQCLENCCHLLFFSQCTTSELLCSYGGDLLTPWFPSAEFVSALQWRVSLLFVHLTTLVDNGNKHLNTECPLLAIMHHNLRRRVPFSVGFVCHASVPTFLFSRSEKCPISCFEVSCILGYLCSIFQTLVLFVLVPMLNVSIYGHEDDLFSNLRWFCSYFLTSILMRSRTQSSSFPRKYSTRMPVEILWDRNMVVTSGLSTNSLMRVFAASGCSLRIPTRHRTESWNTYTFDVNCAAIFFSSNE